MESLEKATARWAETNLKNCIGVDACMKVCPVVDAELTIGHLNESTRPGSPVSKEAEQFANDCVQCGSCDPVCPTAAGRSLMMVYLKSKLKSLDRMHPAYKKYLKLKGYDKNRLLRGLFNFFTKNRLGELAPYIDKKELKKCDTLLYFGCYLFTKEKGALYVKKLADYLEIDYEILGGLKSCCGWPQYLAGDLEGADRYHAYLRQEIEKSQPRVIVTGCAECYMALTKIKALYGASFTPLTTTEWILENREKLALEKSDLAVTYHDSCHLSRKLHKPRPPRQLLSQMVDLKEMKRSGEHDTYCCGYWNLHSNPVLTKNMHRSRFDEIKGTGTDKVVVECITCKESFVQGGSKEAGIEVIDVVEMVHDQVFGKR